MGDRDEDLCSPAVDTNAPTIAADSAQFSDGVALGSTTNGDYFLKKICFWKTKEYLNVQHHTDQSLTFSPKRETVSSLMANDCHSDSLDYDIQILYEFSWDLDNVLNGYVEGQFFLFYLFFVHFFVCYIYIL